MKNILLPLTLIILFYCCKKEDSIEIDIPENNFKNGVYVRIDPRMELLATVQHFTAWADDHHTYLNFDYVNKVENNFSSVSQHSAIIKCQDLIDNGFTYDAPVNYMFFHNNPPDLTLLTPYSSYLTGRAKGEENLVDFAEKLRDFSSSTDFMSFCEENRKFYDQVLTIVFNTLGDDDYTDLLEDYYGEQKYCYNIIPSLLFDGGAYGIRVDFPEGQHVYHVLGPTGLNNGIPTFGNEENFKHLLLHEFSHSFVNPVTEKYIDEVNKSAFRLDADRIPDRDHRNRHSYSLVQGDLNQIRVDELIRDRIPLKSLDHRIPRLRIKRNFEDSIFSRLRP